MATPLNTIKNWFKTGLKPTQSQFWATWDSFWHKNETIPVNSVENLQESLDEKLDSEVYVKEKYTYQTIAELLQNQSQQFLGNKFYVLDASDDPNVNTGAEVTNFDAVYELTAITTTGSIADYTLVATGYVPQTDWNETDNSKKAYLKNKPFIPNNLEPLAFPLSNTSIENYVDRTNLTGLTGTLITLLNYDDGVVSGNFFLVSKTATSTGVMLFSIAKGFSNMHVFTGNLLSDTIILDEHATLTSPDYYVYRFVSGSGTIPLTDGSYQLPLYTIGNIPRDEGGAVTVTDGVNSFSDSTVEFEGATIDDVNNKVIMPRPIASHIIGNRINFRSDQAWIGHYRNYDFGTLLNWNRGTGADAIISPDTGIFTIPIGAKLKKVTMLMRPQSTSITDVTSYQFQIWRFTNHNIAGSSLTFSKSFDETITPSIGSYMQPYEYFEVDLTDTDSTQGSAYSFVIKQNQDVGVDFTAECLITIYYELPLNF